MENAEAASDVANVEQEAVQPQATQEASSESIPAQVDSVENQDSLNTEEEAVNYEELLKQSNAENARRRDKQKALKAENERLAQRLKEMEGKTPTLDSVGGDYDRFEAEKQKHLAKIAYAELQKEESDYKLQEVTDPVTEQAQLELGKANEVFHSKLNEYLNNGGAVAVDVINQKAAVVNEAIIQRPLHEQALLIQELGSVNAAEAMLRLAEDAALRYQIVHGSMFEALHAIHKAETRPKKISNAPEPVPEVDGGGGIPPSGDPTKAKTLSEYRALKSKRG